MPEEPLKKVRPSFDCGDKDFLIGGDCAFRLLLSDREIPHEFRVRDGGHTWSRRRSGIADGLAFDGASFRRQAGLPELSLDSRAGIPLHFVWIHMDTHKYWSPPLSTQPPQSPGRVRSMPRPARTGIPTRTARARLNCEGVGDCLGR